MSWSTSTTWSTSRRTSTRRRCCGSGGSPSAYDIEALRRERTVRGQFVRDVLAAADLDDEQRRRVLVTGLRALDGRDDLDGALMWIQRVTAHAFGPLRGATLELAPGLTVIYGPNESAKSTWHAAIYAALCGRRRGARRDGAATSEFADRHRPWDHDEWLVTRRDPARRRPAGRAAPGSRPPGGLPREGPRPRHRLSAPRS